MAKIDDLIKKYPKVRTSTAKIFNEGDKTPTKKYLEYLFKYWTNTPTHCKPISRELCELVMEFDSLLPYIENKDIYNKQYADIDKLVAVIRKARELKEEKTFVREDNVEVLIENDDYLLIRPLTLKGSMKYGAETRWCTTQANGNHFRNYTNRGFLYYLISKRVRNNGYNKIAFNIDRKTNVMTSLVEIYQQSDLNVEEYNVLNGGWTTFELFEIMMKIRANAYELSVLEKTKKDVDSVITKLKSIDLDTFFKNVDYVNKYDNSGSEYKEKLNNLLDTLTEKMNN